MTTGSVVSEDGATSIVRKIRLYDLIELKQVTDPGIWAIESSICYIGQDGCLATGGVYVTEEDCDGLLKDGAINGYAPVPAVVNFHESDGFTWYE